MLNKFNFAKQQRIVLMSGKVNKQELLKLSEKQVDLC